MEQLESLALNYQYLAISLTFYTKSIYVVEIGINRQKWITSYLIENSPELSFNFLNASSMQSLHPHRVKNW